MQKPFRIFIFQSKMKIYIVKHFFYGIDMQT